ncbi:MAG: hypothetical protein RL106_2068, partial [Bacteroidota bacterium]
VATIILSTHDMGSVEELCDEIGLIHQSNLIISGPVKSVKEKFKQHLFEVEYIGTAMELGISLGHQFELIDHQILDGFNKAKIKIHGGLKLNDLLRAVMQHNEIVSARELVPTMNEIFIQAVTAKQLNHE